MMIAYFATGVICTALILLFRRKTLSMVLAGLFLAIQLGITLWIIMNRGRLVSVFFELDELAVMFVSILFLLALFMFYHSSRLLNQCNSASCSIYHAGFIALVTSLTGVYTSANLTVSWVFLEATTLSVAALIYHNRTMRALEATWKYVFISSVGIALAYIGILFVSLTLKSTPSADMSFTSLGTALQQANPLYLKLAFLFVLIGYSAKMEIFPLYTIGIDANYVAPAPASAFISTAMVNAGFISIFRLYKVYALTPVAAWSRHVMVLTGVVSVAIAAIYMLRVKNYKRMFAYSTVEHMGLAAIGLGIGGAGIVAAILQVLIHSFAKSAVFFQLGQAHKILKTYRIGKTGGYMQIHPAGAIALLTATIVLTAIPPSGLFVPEWLLFSHMAVAGKWVLFALVVALLTLVIYGMYSRILPLLYVENERTYVDGRYVISSETGTQYFLLAITIAMCFIHPDFLYQLIYRAAGISL